MLVLWKKDMKFPHGHIWMGEGDVGEDELVESISVSWLLWHRAVLKKWVAEFRWIEGTLGMVKHVADFKTDNIEMDIGPIPYSLPPP